jgi:beta-glucosidase
MSRFHWASGVLLFMCIAGPDADGHLHLVSQNQLEPSISPGRILNAASYSGTVAPGSIATIFGSFLVSTPAEVFTVPWPGNLAGLAIQFGNATAPLYYASDPQISIQVPWEMAGQSQAVVRAMINLQTSAPQTVNVAPFAPGIFSMNGQGNGQGAIVDSTTYRLTDSLNPAAAGITYLQIYCTGLGAVTNQPATGAPAPANQLAATTTTPTVTVGGVPAKVLFSGLAPGEVGVYVVNTQVPESTAPGGAVPVTISMGEATSNAVTIAVRRPTSDQRADVLLRQMTQDERLQLVHGGGAVTSNTVIPRGAAGWVPGIPRLGIPDLYLADGSVGVGNGVGPATALPSSIASAASWDLLEAYDYGKVIGAESRAYGINVNLGGNVNLIGREPRDGRTFETKGEDPILAGRITAAHIRAIQDEHVLGGIKHFALNDQETSRTSANVLIDERGARESDLLAFEIGIKDSNVQSVMCSHNLLDGVYACENPHLLNEVLKGDWGFRGFVMSDWWATHSTASAALAGLDQEQPNDAWMVSLGQAIQNGAVPQSRLDDMVHRILRAMYEAGIFDYPATMGPIDTVADEAIAQTAEEQGAVLLKNAGAQLPLNASTIRSIAVIGSHADIGVLSGGGSAQVTPTGGPALTEGYPCPPCWSQVIWIPSSPLKAIQAKAPNASVRFDRGTDPASAVSLAASSDVAIVFVSQWTSEGMDLPTLNFSGNQDALVAAVAAANPHTIVVMEIGGPQVLPWLNDVAAVLEAWFPGQRGGEAIANILFGIVNPSGKLPLTFPASVADLPYPAIAGSDNIFPVTYSEGLQVGYKWYDSNNITPLFPFGFGLSYTKFSFSNVQLVNNMRSSNPNFQVTFDLTNTGPAAGAEVAQVYLGLPASTGEPPKRLAGWQKAFLQPGEARHVTVEIDENDTAHPLSWWDASSNAWRTAPGDYVVYLGNSSASAGLIRAGLLHVSL